MSDSDAAIAIDGDAAFDDGSVADGGPVVLCEAQRIESCVCATGTGTRECLPDGSRWGDCDCTVYGQEIFVATTGNDAASGAAGSPKATLGGALAVVHGLVAGPGLPAGGVVIWMAGGVYSLPTTQNLNVDVTGSPGRPVVIRAQAGAPVRFTGGTVLPSSSFTPVNTTDPLYSRMDTTARVHIMVFDLPGNGITNYGTLRARGFNGPAITAMELFVDDEPMRLGRWPDIDQNDAPPLQSATGTDLDVYGTVSPDVTGHYVQMGTNDGVSVFQRVGLVGGRQYRLYRRNWVYNATAYRAWFLTTQPAGSGTSNVDPWWTQYDGSDAAVLHGTMDPNAGATGTIRFTDPSAINHGHVETAAPVTATSFSYLQDRPSRWAAAPDAWVHGNWSHFWADFHLPVTSIDTSRRSISVGTSPGFGFAAKRPWYAYNLLEEVTEGGEWYLDRSSGRLYFYPPYALGSAAVTVSMSDGPLLQLNGVSNVELHGVVLEASRGALLQITGGAHVRLVGVTMQNAGTNGATITGTDHGVQYSLVRNVGAIGVVFRGGDRRTLTAGNNFIEDSELHHFGRWDTTTAPGVELFDMANRASHNEFHDAPSAAVVYEGNEHQIEFNNIHDGDRLTHDAAAIYGARDWGYRGNLIRYNYVHDLHSIFPEGEGGIHGVYLDDCLSGERVEGNVFVNIDDSAVFQNGGRDNNMVGNVFVNDGGGLQASSRCFFNPPNNIPGDSFNLLGRIQAMNYQSPPWSVRYPALALIPNDYNTIVNPALTWLYPEGNVFSSNVGSQIDAPHWMADDGVSFPHYAARANNVALATSPFVDGVGRDLTLTPAVLATPGFAPIAVEQIGIR